MKNARLALCTDFNNKLVIPSLIVISQLGLDFFFFKDAQDLLNYRAHMLLGGIRAGLPPEKNYHLN